MAYLKAVMFGLVSTQWPGMSAFPGSSCALSFSRETVSLSEAGLYMPVVLVLWIKTVRISTSSRPA